MPVARNPFSAGLAEEQATPAQQLRQRRSSYLAEPPARAFVRECPELLGHGEAALPEPALRGQYLEVKCVGEIGSRQRDDE